VSAGSRVTEAPAARRARRADQLRPARRGPSHRERGRLPTQVGVMTFLFICAVYFVLPVYWVLVSATKSAPTLFGSFGLWFSHFQLGTNLHELVTADNGIFLRWLLNSVIYAGVGAVVATAISAAAGYALAKYEFRGRETIFSIVLAGVMVPATALALPLYLMVSKIGMANSYWSVLLPSLVSPFGVYLARVYAAAAVPDAIIEAARIDGASEFRVFTRVAAPVMKPALVTIGLFTFVGIWNNFFLPLVMLSSNSLYPLSLGLYVWEGETYRAPLYYQLTVTGSAVSAVLLILAVISLQRYWRSGLTAGSTQ
jgi:multiple sugar transport system permease protein